MEITFAVKLYSDKFWSRIDVRGPGDCWLPHIRVADGEHHRYYRFTASKGIAFQGHRFAYTDRVGEIPPRLVLDHLCRTPACVNPSHLEPVDHRENVIRGAHCILKTHCKRGHAYIEGNIYISPRGDRSCITCRRDAEAAYAEKLKQRRRERGLYKRYADGEAAIGHNRLSK